MEQSDGRLQVELKNIDQVAILSECEDEAEFKSDYEDRRADTIGALSEHKRRWPPSEPPTGIPILRKKAAAHVAIHLSRLPDSPHLISRGRRRERRAQWRQPACRRPYHLHSLSTPLTTSVHSTRLCNRPPYPPKSRTRSPHGCCPTPSSLNPNLCVRALCVCSDDFSVVASSLLLCRAGGGPRLA